MVLRMEEVTTSARLQGIMGETRFYGIIEFDESTHS
jgi:hypothetical protein